MSLPCSLGLITSPMVGYFSSIRGKRYFDKMVMFIIQKLEIDVSKYDLNASAVLHYMNIL